jgi:hypothetical protein
LGNTVLAILTAASIAILQSPLLHNFYGNNFYQFRAYWGGIQWLKEEVHLQGFDINHHIAEENKMNSSFCTIAPWQYGHHLQFYSHIPTIADGFAYIYMNANPWDGFYDMMKFFLSENEEDAVAIMEKYKCGYVLVPPYHIFEGYPQFIGANNNDYYLYQRTDIDGIVHYQRKPTAKLFNTISFRLSELYGSSNPTPDDAAMNMKALKHFKLIYELPETIFAGKAIPAGALKIYKYTKGTYLPISERLDLPYSLKAKIRTNLNLDFYYRQNGYLYEKVLAPYPTDPRGNYPYAINYEVLANNHTYTFQNIPDSDHN